MSVPLGWGNRLDPQKQLRQIHDILTCMACGHTVEMGFWDVNGVYHCRIPEDLEHELELHETTHLECCHGNT